MQPAGLTWRPAPPTRVIRRVSRVMRRATRVTVRKARVLRLLTVVPPPYCLTLRSGAGAARRSGSVQLDEQDFLKLTALPSGVPLLKKNLFVAATEYLWRGGWEEVPRSQHRKLAILRIIKPTPTHPHARPRARTHTHTGITSV